MKTVLYVFLMAFTTYVIRLLPLTVFRSKIKNRFFNSFLEYVPYACLASMTFPAIFHSTNMLCSGIAAALVALLLSYFKKSLVVVASATCMTVLITEWIATYF